MTYFFLINTINHVVDMNMRYSILHITPIHMLGKVYTRLQPMAVLAHGSSNIELGVTQLQSGRRHEETGPPAPQLSSLHTRQALSEDV